MKKIFLMSLILVTIITLSIFLVFKNRETLPDNIMMNIEVEKVGIDFADLSLSYANLDNLVYELRENNTIIKKDNIKPNINFENLKPNTKYTLKVYNKFFSKVKEFTTNKTTILRFGGDVMMTSYFADYIAMHGIDYMWKDVSNLFKSADYSFVNLETSISTRGNSNKPEGYGFRSNPNTLQGLVNAGIDFVTIANNHVFDYGEYAFYDTMKHLDEYNIGYTGAGKNIEEASKIYYKEIDDIKFSFISATQVLGNTIWEATDTNPGLLSLKEHNYNLIKTKIKEAKQNSDYVILNLHWGIEYNIYPEQFQIDLAHELIDSGADIIVGHHPHVLQGIEHYNDGIIFYSIGNFNFLVSEKNTTETGVFEIELDKDSLISSKIYPVFINSCKANLLKSNSQIYNDIINNLNERSKSFNTSVLDNGNIIMKKD